MSSKFKKTFSCLLSMGIASSPCLGASVLASNAKFKNITESVETSACKIENYESEVLNEIRYKIKDLSEMAYTEQAFLNGLIRKYKPKKILELGVSAGGSSAVMLNATKDMPETKIHSIDKLPYYYRNPKKPAGYIVQEKCPELMSDRWKLYTDGIPCDFMDEIGEGIDFCLIDTVHTRPGEICDFLSVLPYLKEDAVVCFHDIGAAFTWGLDLKPAYYSNDVLFSAIKGEKLMPKTQYTEFFSNIGAIKLNSDQKPFILDYFLLFTLPWEYIPENSDNKKLIDHFNRHYDNEIVEMYIKAVNANKKYHDKVRIR